MNDSPITEYLNDKKAFAAVKERVKEEIRNRLEELYPQYTVGMPSTFPIYIHVSSPREGMGRFSPAKLTWTINVENKRTFTRVKQIRVKVSRDGKWLFDETKLAEKVNECLAETAAKEKAEQAETALKNCIPNDLPHGLHVTTSTIRPGTFKVEYATYCGSVEDMQKLVAGFRWFLEQKEKQK